MEEFRIREVFFSNIDFSLKSDFLEEYFFFSKNRNFRCKIGCNLLFFVTEKLN